MSRSNKTMLAETGLMVVLAAVFLTLASNVVGASMGNYSIPGWYFPASVLAGVAFLVAMWRLSLRLAARGPPGGDPGNNSEAEEA